MRLGARAALISVWVAGFLPVLVPPVMAQDARGLVGRWRSVQTSQGGIGAMYEFRADGTMRFSPGAIVDMPYRLEGNQLVLPPATTNGPEQKSTIEWTGNDVFRMTAGGQAAGPYRRQGRQQDSGNPLVGEWLGSQQMDGRNLEMRFIFDASGSCEMLIKFTTQQGKYSAIGKRLVAQINGATALDGTFAISDSVLTIQRSGGRTTTLKRY